MIRHAPPLLMLAALALPGCNRDKSDAEPGKQASIKAVEPSKDSRKAAPSEGKPSGVVEADDDEAADDESPRGHEALDEEGDPEEAPQEE